jgi:hypothetical protein
MQLMLVVELQNMHSITSVHLCVQFPQLCELVPCLYVLCEQVELVAIVGQGRVLQGMRSKQQTHEQGGKQHKYLHC